MVAAPSFGKLGCSNFFPSAAGLLGGRFMHPRRAQWFVLTALVSWMGGGESPRWTNSGVQQMLGVYDVRMVADDFGMPTKEDLLWQASLLEADRSLVVEATTPQCGDPRCDFEFDHRFGRNLPVVCSRCTGFFCDNHICYNPLHGARCVPCVFARDGAEEGWQRSSFAESPVPDWARRRRRADGDGGVQTVVTGNAVVPTQTPRRRRSSDYDYDNAVVEEARRRRRSDSDEDMVAIATTTTSTDPDVGDVDDPLTVPSPLQEAVGGAQRHVATSRSRFGERWEERDSYFGCGGARAERQDRHQSRGRHFTRMGC